MFSSRSSDKEIPCSPQSPPLLPGPQRGPLPGPQRGPLPGPQRGLLPGLALVHVLVPQDLVEDPVEDVEEEEGQGEAGPRHRVDLLGAVDEQLPHLLVGFAARAGGRLPPRRPGQGVGGQGRAPSWGGRYGNGTVCAGLGNRLLVVAVGGACDTAVLVSDLVFL